jgi:hypothetical protein
VRWEPDGVVAEISLLEVDSREPGEPFEVTATWSAATDADAETFTATLAPGPVGFALTLDIGVLLGAVPLTGGATATWACRPATAPLAATTVAAVSGPTEPEPEPAPTTTTTGAAAAPTSDSVDTGSPSSPRGPVPVSPAVPVPVPADFAG